MHTDPTVAIFDDVTVDIGAKFRTFERQTCSAFDTRELNREANARKRRRKKRPASNVANSSDPFDETRPKKFNLQIYKYHSLGDYPDTIRRYGTTDSYSTEPVSILIHHYMPNYSMLMGSMQMELEHRKPKSRYKRTDKKKPFIKQLARIERREARLRRIRAKLSKGSSDNTREAVGTTPHEHHHIGVSQNQFEHLGTFLRDHSGDPAIKVRHICMSRTVHNK